MKITDLPETKLAITSDLSIYATNTQVIKKVNEIIKKINFLDEHINFLYQRSRTQYNTLMDVQKGMQNVYDEFIEFKSRFNTLDVKSSKQRELESLSSKLDLLEHTSNN